MNIAYLNIGTNQGHRQSNLDKAVALIRYTFPTSYIVVSTPVTSPPWGYESPNEFINIGVRMTTDLLPIRLLDTLQNIERTISPKAHRDADGHYIDRIIDIDIIAMQKSDGSDYVVNTPRLTLPHPLMHVRRFVLLPMIEIAPKWRHPLLSLTAEEMLMSI